MVFQIKIKSEKQSYLNRHNLNKKYFSMIYKIYLFIILFLLSYSQLEINLIIQGKGEQKFLNELFYKDPSEVIVNGVSNNSCKKRCNFGYELNNLTIKFDSLIESCEFMFNGLNNIIEIDLSNLDTSKVNNMYNMFSDCINLEKIIFGNINTSSVKNMSKLFYNCQKIISLDVSNFNTESVTTMNSMFSHCNILTSLDVLNFNTKNVEDLYEMFSHSQEILFLNLSNFNTSKVQNMKGIFYNCSKLRYLDLSNYEGNSVTTVRSIVRFCSSLVYIKLNSFTIKSGTETKYVFDSTFSELKICIQDSATRNILSNYNSTFDCSHICFLENIKIDLKNNKCVQSCKENEFKYEHNTLCYEKCPGKTYPIDGEYLCLDQKPKNYYLDSNSLTYKKCFDNCERCDKGGNETYNNCIDCKSHYVHSNGSMYEFLYEFIIDNYKNCYIKCPFYLYFDKTNNTYYCTKNLSCPENYNIMKKK